MTAVSEMLERIRELSEESAVEVQQENTASLSSYRDPNYGAVPPSVSLDLSGVFNNAGWSNTVVNGGTTSSPYAWGNLIASPNVSITAGTGLYNHSAVGGYTFAPVGTGPSAKLNLNGEGADITVNGWSLVDAIQKIEERLNILTPNAKMESEWDQLRELGEQYRALEKKLQEQGDMWARLKAMPPPEID